MIMCKGGDNMAFQFLCRRCLADNGWVLGSSDWEKIGYPVDAEGRPVAGVCEKCGEITSLGSFTSLVFFDDMY